VWITHAGVIRAAGLLARGVTHLDDASQWPREAPGFGAWTVVDLP
jgi:alpha-ribazole phosphatase